MHFILGALLVVGFIALLIGSPAFRMAAIVVVGVIGLGVFALVQSSNRDSERSEQQRVAEKAQEAARWRRVVPADLQVTAQLRAARDLPSRHS